MTVRRAGEVRQARDVRQARAVRLGPRSLAALALVSAVGVVAFGWPFLAPPASALTAHAQDAPWLFAGLLVLLVAVVAATISESGLGPKAVAMLGVLAATGAALRPIGAGTAGLEPMFFLMVLSGRVLGPGFGFVLGAITMFASALLTGGVGPWLPFQMLAMGWFTMGAGLLPGPDRLRGRPEVWLLAGYGFLAAFAYGTVMNMAGWPFMSALASGIAFDPDASLAGNLARFTAYCLATSLGWDLGRAVITVVLTLTLGRPVLKALRRATRRAAFEAPVTFRDPAEVKHPTCRGSPTRQGRSRDPRPGAGLRPHPTPRATQASKRDLCGHIRPSASVDDVARRRCAHQGHGAAPCPRRSGTSRTATAQSDRHAPDRKAACVRRFLPPYDLRPQEGSGRYRPGRRHLRRPDRRRSRPGRRLRLGAGDRQEDDRQLGAVPVLLEDRRARERLEPDRDQRLQRCVRAGSGASGLEDGLGRLGLEDQPRHADQVGPGLHERALRQPVRGVGVLAGQQLVLSRSRHP